MSIAFYMDVHVPKAITIALRQRGVDVLTAQEDDSALLADPDLLDRATQLGRVIFSRDDDFLREAARRQREDVAFAGVIFGHQLGVTIGRCVEDLELIAEAYDLEDIAGMVEWLPL